MRKGEYLSQQRVHLLVHLPSNNNTSRRPAQCARPPSAHSDEGQQVWESVNDLRGAKARTEVYTLIRLGGPYAKWSCTASSVLSQHLHAHDMLPLCLRKSTVESS
jgi:hypothetical protein